MKLAAVGGGLWLWGAGYGLCTAYAAPPKPRGPSPTTASVSIAGFTFGPAEVTVSVGDTVAWVNGDPLPHTTTADSGAWSSPEMARGQRFTFVPKQAGRFPYHCAAHPVMRAVIVVRD